jgi:glycosyltransferase involved in cell wall biosynthesis
VTTPAVTVVVTTFRHAPFVREALDSLTAQTTRDFEVIITDDASGDGTVDVIQAWLDEGHLPARFIRNSTNRGLCANRNTARRITSGEFICSLSGDDVYEPERLQRQIACFREQPSSVAAIFSDASTIDENGARVSDSFLRKFLGDEPVPDGERLFRRLLRGNFIPAPTVMVRRSALDAVGGYDESLFIDDWDMWLRLSSQFAFHYLPGALVKYRVLPTSMSHDPALHYVRVESAFSTLAPWLGRCGEAEPELADALWQLATQAMRLGNLSGAQRMMSLAASAQGHPRRRVLAWLIKKPGAFGPVRVVHHAYQSVLARLSAIPLLVTPNL